MGKRDEARQRFLVVRNPAAGGARDARIARTLSLLRAEGCDLRELETDPKGGAGVVLEAQDLAQWDAVVVVGGDGTVKEAAEVLTRAGPPLALIPAGTANVLAFELGLPRRPEDLAVVIRGAPSERISLGRYEVADSSGHFVLMAGAGFDARVVAGISPGLKRVIGKGAYLWSSFRQTFRSQAPPVRLRIDGTEIETAWAIVSNVSRYAGDYIVAPRASLRGETFQICLYDRSGPAAMARFGLAMNRGDMGGLSGYRAVEGQRVEILLPRGEPLQVDGDPGGCLPARIERLPDALELIAPPRLA
jgi:diacylglycerol kinase family enzyme